MKIVQLKAENVKRLTAVEITPDGNVVVLKGKNRQGKSSILDAIEMAFAGKGAQPPNPIRKGQTDAQVIVDLGDLVVHRRWTSDNSSWLEVRNKEGASYASPQKMLDKVFSSLSFDPVAFMQLDAQAQAEMVRKLVGLDFKALDAKRTAKYDARTVINREGHALKARIEALPPPKGVKRIDVTQLLVRMRALTDDERKTTALRGAAEDAHNQYIHSHQVTLRALGELERIEAALKRAKEEVESSQQAEDAKKKAWDDLEQAAKAAPDHSKEIEALKAEIEGAEANNNQVRAEEERVKMDADLTKLRNDSNALTKEIEEIDKDKAAQLSKAKFPVPGMGFSDAGLLLNELPFEQASSAEQIEVSMAMGAALNPQLRVILIRDGDHLDEDAMAQVFKFAEERDIQVWLERVGNRDPMGILIEDGHVALKVAEQAKETAS